MRLGETGPRERRRWSVLPVDTDMAAEDEGERGRREVAEENEKTAKE